jgi:hypothetical protein
MLRFYIFFLVFFKQTLEVLNNTILIIYDFFGNGQTGKVYRAKTAQLDSW